MFCISTSTAGGGATCGGGYNFDLRYGANQDSLSDFWDGTFNTTSTSTYTSTSTFLSSARGINIAAGDSLFLITSAASSSNDSISVILEGFWAP